MSYSINVKFFTPYGKLNHIGYYYSSEKCKEIAEKIANVYNKQITWNLNGNEKWTATVDISDKFSSDCFNFTLGLYEYPFKKSDIDDNDNGNDNVNKNYYIQFYILKNEVSYGRHEIMNPQIQMLLYGKVLSINESTLDDYFN